MGRAADKGGCRYRGSVTRVRKTLLPPRASASTRRYGPHTAGRSCGFGVRHIKKPGSGETDFTGPQRPAAPPTSDTMDAWWCGARNGVRPTARPRVGRSRRRSAPRHREGLVGAERGQETGESLGQHRLTRTSGPVMKRWCGPAAATSRARRPRAWPRRPPGRVPLRRPPQAVPEVAATTRTDLAAPGPARPAWPPRGPPRRVARPVGRRMRLPPKRQVLQDAFE